MKKKHQAIYDKGYLDGYYIGVQSIQEEVAKEVEAEVKIQCRQYAMQIDKLKQQIREKEDAQQTEFYQGIFGNTAFQCSECRTWNKLPTGFGVKRTDDLANGSDGGYDAVYGWDAGAD